MVVAVLACALLIATAIAVASILRLNSFAEFLLAAYVIAFAEIVALVIVLSPFGAARRTYLLAGVGALALVAIGLWLWFGRPRPITVSWSAVSTLLRNPSIGFLAVGISFALTYVAVLIIMTPPANWDSLTYHLARAAFWRQDGGIGYIENAYDARLNIFPPNGEIALMFVLELARDERPTGFVQFGAAVVCALGVFALARRVGLSRAESALGSLLFLTLPIVVLEASTTQNDLVVASLLLCASVFLLAGSTRSFVLASLAIALAVGTKVTAIYALPILLSLAVVATPHAVRLRRIATVGVGAVLGSYWFVVNQVETSHAVGGEANTGGLPLLQPRENLLATIARASDAFDLSGASGADVLVYGIVSLLFAIGLWVRHRSVQAIFTGLLIGAAVVVVPLGYALWLIASELHGVLGASALYFYRLLAVDEWPPPTQASDTYSWFGPIGILLVIWIATVVASHVRNRRLPVAAFVLGFAPIAWLVFLGLSLPYDPSHGRYFIFPVALSASLWGVVLGSSRRTIAVVTVALLGMYLSLINFTEKPSGLRVLGSEVTRSSLRMERWQVQSLVRSEMAPVLRFLDEQVPKADSIALAIGQDDFGYPAFGANLERSVELIPLLSRGDDIRADWLVANRSRSRMIDRSCWMPVLRADNGWHVFRARRPECSA